MFEVDTVWDDTQDEQTLSKSLFDKFEFNNKTAIVKPSINAKLKDSEGSPNRLTREQWKRKQKNIRRAKKKKLNATTNNMLKPDSEHEQEDKNDSEKKGQNTASKLENDPPSAKKSRKDGVANSKKKSNADVNHQRSTAGKLLQDKLTVKLQSSRFRYINEQMYTRSSKETMDLFESSSDAFNIYHNGFLSQVAKWPVKPLDSIIKWVKTKSAKLTIADFGCGEAFLAQSVKNKVHSFDLCALNKHVTVADISNVPLEAESVDIVVFCLALMGTNMQDFIYEANRVLKQKGILKVAEVASRFGGTKKFINSMRKLGFQLLKQNTKDSHFYMFDFEKVKTVQQSSRNNSSQVLQLKPCLYKKR